MIRWFKEITSSICSTSSGKVNCQVCGRSRRIPPELMPNAQYFVCRDCVARAFPDLDTNRNRRGGGGRQYDNIHNRDNNNRRGIESTLYDPTEAERLDEHPVTNDDEARQENRLKAMERAKSQTFEIKRVTSTFFKVNSSKNVETTPTPHGSLELSDLALDGDDDGTCKICMENPATIILLPCGHGGLCQGCAKDLVLAGKTCYICREEFTMLAEMSQKWPNEHNNGKDKDDNDEEESKEYTNIKGEYLGRMIRPDALHHATSTAVVSVPDDGHTILNARELTTGEDLDTLTSFSGNNGNDDYDAATSSCETPPESRSVNMSSRGVSTGTATAEDSRGRSAIIAL